MLLYKTLLAYFANSWTHFRVTHHELLTFKTLKDF